MAVLAQYQAPAPPGFAADSLIQGLNAGQSLMERKQAMALRQQQADQQRMELIAKLPLISAQARLTTVNADTAIQNATERTNFEAKAANESVAANKEFMDVEQFTVGTPELDQDGDPTGKDNVNTQATWDARANKLAALRAKYSYMSGLGGGYGAFYDTITKAWISANENTHFNLKAEENLAVANAKADALKFGSLNRLEGTKYTADAKTTNADIYSKSREKIAQINSDTKLTVQQRAAQSAAVKEGATLENLSRLANEADQRAAEATAEGDKVLAKRHLETASALRDDMKRISTHPGVDASAPEATPPPLAKTPDEDITTSAEQSAADSAITNPVVVAPKEPVKVGPKDKTITVGGKTYPVFVDKAGKRAYRIDATHWVELGTE